MKRPAYLERKIALRQAQAEARRTHRQSCECSYCISRERLHQRLLEAVERSRPSDQEVPF